MVLFKSLSIGTMTIYMSSVNQFASAFNGINSYLELAKSGPMIHEFMQIYGYAVKAVRDGNKGANF